MKENDFDYIAPCYDFLQHLVFSNSLLAAQSSLLPLIEEGPILIIGGGSGTILKYIPAGIGPVTFVDASSKMIHLATRRNLEATFIHADYRNITITETFQTVICPFFLDLFEFQDLREVLLRIMSQLKSGGHLLVSDFEYGSGSRHRILVPLMHFFFMITTNMQSRSLKPIGREIEEMGFKLAHERFFRRNLIFSRLYQK